MKSKILILDNKIYSLSKISNFLKQKKFDVVKPTETQSVFNICTKADLDAVKFLRKDYKGFNPDHPDRFEDFKWNLCPFTEIEKPDGN